MVRFSCPKCGKRLKAPSELAGKPVKCVRCGSSQRAPSTPTARGEAAAPPTGAAARGGDLPRPEAPPSAPIWKNRLLFVWVRRIAVALAAVAGVCLVAFFLTPSAVDQRLTDLKAADAAKSQPALEWLAEAVPQNSQRARVTAALEPLLLDGDPHGNLDPVLVLRAYLDWAGKDNVPAMIRMVRNPTLPSWGPVSTALVMEALGKLQDGRAAEALAEKLSDPDLHAQAVNALELLGPQAEQDVLDRLFDGDPDTRLRASRLLADYGVSPDAIADEALSRLQSGRADVRRGAVVWFVDNPPSGEARRAAAAQPLAALLDDDSADVRRQALDALKLWATKDCLPQLLTYARSEQKNPAGDPLLIDVLSRLPDESAAEAIALQLPNAHTRDRAAQALLALGPAAVNAVLPSLDDPDAAVRQAARDLCRRLNIPDDRQLDQTLADVADARVPRSLAALQRLATLRPDEASRAKVSAALNAALLDPHGDVRDAALNAVKVWGSPDNTAALLKVLAAARAEGQGRDAGVIDILGSLKDPKAAPALAQELTDPRVGEGAGRALISIGPAAEPAVIPFLQGAETGARIEACRVLGEVGGAASVKPLQDVARSLPPDQAGYVLGQEAQLALQKIMARA